MSGLRLSVIVPVLMPVAFVLMTGQGCPPDDETPGDVTPVASASPSSGTWSVDVTLDCQVAGGFGTFTYGWSADPPAEIHHPNLNFGLASVTLTNETDAPVTWVLTCLVVDGSGVSRVAGVSVTVQPAGPPDLVIDALSHTPQNVSRDTPATVSVVISNAGTGPAGASTLRLDTGDGSEPLLHDVPALEPGQSHTVAFEVTRPVGEYTVTAVVDADDEVAEADEANNGTTDAYTVYDAELPDLAVTDFSWELVEATPPLAVQFTIEVTNVGVGMSAGSLLSIDGGGTVDTWYYEVPPLLPDGSYTITHTIDQSYGAFTATADPDSLGHVVEANEDNNEATLDYELIEPGLPDLTVTSLTHAPPEPTGSEVITLTAVVSNLGNEDSEPCVLELDAGGEADPPTYAVPALAPEATHAVVRQLTLDARSYTARARVDSAEEIDESDEENNELTHAYTVIVPFVEGYPDTVAATVSVETGPSHAIVTADGFLYVTNLDDETVSVVDLADRTVVDTIPVGSWPEGLAEAGGFVFVANGASDSVSVIRTADRTVVETIPVGGYPRRVLASPAGDRVYVTDYTDGTVEVIDGSSHVVLDTIDTGTLASGLAMSPDGSELYVTDENQGTITVVGTADHAVLRTRAIGGEPAAVLVLPDGQHLYVDGNLPAVISVVRTSDLEVVGTIPVSGEMAVLPGGQYVFVAEDPANRITVLATGDHSIVDTILTSPASRPHAATASSDGLYMYVTMAGIEQVWVLER